MYIAIALVVTNNKSEYMKLITFILLFLYFEIYKDVLWFNIQACTKGGRAVSTVSISESAAIRAVEV